MTEENEILYRIAKFMNSMSDMEKLLEIIIDEGKKSIEAEACSLALYDEAQDELYFYVAINTEKEVGQKLKRIRMKMGEGIIGWVAVNKQLLNVTDVYNDPRFYKEADKETGFVTRSILAVPMIHAGKLIGVIEAINKIEQEGFSENDKRVFTVLAAQAALVIENARLYNENLKKARLSALGEGIAGAAHFVKNILNGIEAGGYILERGVKNENLDGIAKGWNIMKRNNKLMKNLVLDMLTYSKDRKPEYDLIDINSLCEAITQLMSQKAEDNNVEIKFHPSPNIGEICLDEKGIYRCILNLVSNAIDACDKSPGIVEIIIKPIKDDKWVQITVSDNGCGISQENLKKLFDSFFSTKGSKGTGLGLAITQKIISEHKGNIDVESKLGEGTKFIIELPINREIPQ
ncbi:MAG: ATP-binding protein [Candidatus Heimdallarchaeaceae archaeon]